VQEFSASLWLDIKNAMVARSSDPDPELQQSIRQGLVGFGEAVLQDATLQAKMNRWLEDAVIYLVGQYGHEVESLIANTIRRWDAESTVQKIELQVGRDLQFIRINGTLVGGLAGLIIHTVSVLL
jgi:uncharacterized membrane-anchored protein YjiN (DUF445 family)